MKTLVLANQKGGVGKSAVATQLAYYLAQRKCRVLVVDFDHQRNTTKPIQLSGRAAVADFTATQLLEGQAGALPEASFVLVPADEKLSSLERQPDKHNVFVNAAKVYLDRVADKFDICIIDTNPNPDIRYVVALVIGDYILSPIQLNQEAIDGVGSLLNHSRYGYRNIKAKLNPRLELIGILPNMVEPTPFQKANFGQLVQAHPGLLVPTSQDPPQFAFIPKRSAVAEAQASGDYIAEVKKTAARDTWRELKPVFDVVAQRMQLNLEA